MFVCIFCTCFNETSFLLTDITNYVTTSSPALGAHERLDGKLCILASLKWTLKTLIRLDEC